MFIDHYIVKHGNLFDTKNLISDKTSGVNSNNESPTIAMNNSSDIYFNTANSWLTSNNLDQLKSLQKILYSKLKPKTNRIWKTLILIRY